MIKPRKKLTTTTREEIATTVPQITTSVYNGYKRIWNEDNVRVREHRYIFEKHLKRKLSSLEVVHHINQNRLDNRIENLTIMNKPAHSLFHKMTDDDKKLVKIIHGGITKIFKNNKEILPKIIIYDNIQTIPTPQQMDLDGKIHFTLNQKYKLSPNQIKLMETFYLNPDSEVSPLLLFNSWGNQMHENAIHRFIKRAKINAWIRELAIIPGATINNLFAFYQEPDRLETGKVIYDGRCKYYQITKLGKKIFEINEKLKESLEIKFNKIKNV